jgi:hypothetical protein
MRAARRSACFGDGFVEKSAPERERRFVVDEEAKDGATPAPKNKTVAISLVFNTHTQTRCRVVSIGGQGSREEEGGGGGEGAGRGGPRGEAGQPSKPTRAKTQNLKNDKTKYWCPRGGARERIEKRTRALEQKHSERGGAGGRCGDARARAHRRGALALRAAASFAHSLALAFCFFSRRLPRSFFPLAPPLWT